MINPVFYAVKVMDEPYSAMRHALALRPPTPTRLLPKSYAVLEPSSLAARALLIDISSIDKGVTVRLIDAKFRPTS